jgi:hypothetical protein
MPNRILRDSLLDSERYLSLSSAEARLLFVEMLLLADDYGLMPAGWMFISRRTSVGLGKPRAAVEPLLLELADADLIRLYRVDNLSTGAGWYAYIPRFNNWPRSTKSKWPLPPDELGGNEIKHLQQKRSASEVHRQCVRSASARETETETESEEEELQRSATFLGTKEDRSFEKEWEVSEASLALAREDGMDADTLERERRAFVTWHRKRGTRPGNVDALWRSWVGFWKARNATQNASEGAARTLAYLEDQKRHREASRPPPAALLALRKAGGKANA